MKMIKLTTICFFCFLITNCGKVGPLALPEEKLNKSIITYPCDEVCKKKFEEEKLRLKSVVLLTD